jgi:pimeloyl-ACP methyl ester carboxylesterase
VPPAEAKLEVFSQLPAKRTGKPPLLFVHGGYCDAWCWTPYFLPWFAEHGWPAHALSLRGHGNSGGHDTLFIAGLDDYVADVLAVAATLPAPPVLVGHSMGAAIVERIVAAHDVPAAALLAPVPPTGLIPMAARLAAERPDYLLQMGQLDPTALSADVLATLRPFYFSDRVERRILAEALRHLNSESSRALFDLSLRLPFPPPAHRRAPVLVLGSQADHICTPHEVQATARHHGVEAVILPALAHMLMLEPGWRTAAKAIADWLAGLAGGTRSARAKAKGLGVRD